MGAQNKKKNVLFRVDAGGSIGLGHYYRSLSLARELDLNGFNIYFSFLDSDFWQARLCQGIKYKTFALNASDWESRTIQIINELEIIIFYVDGIIEFEKSFIRRVKEKARIIFYQNISASKNMADVFIMPSMVEEDDFYTSFNTITKIYKGIDYLVLNEKLNSIQQKQLIKGPLRRVAIAAGGSDPENCLLKIYNHINRLNSTEIEFNLFYGLDYIHKSSIPGTLDENIRFLPFNHEQILSHDLFITAFGVSTYEFLYLGMPVISYGHSLRNTTVSNKLATASEAIISIGHIDQLSEDIINEVITECSDFDVRRDLSEKACSLVDLQGKRRITEIFKSTV